MTSLMRPSRRQNEVRTSVLATHGGEWILTYLIISFTINAMPPKKKNKLSYMQLETLKKNKIIGAT